MNNTQLIQSLSDLPNLAGCSEIVLDFETTSGNRAIDSLNPHFDCSVAGVCICDANNSPGYYVPVGHRHETPYERNLDKSAVARWLFDVLQGCNTLVGHNIKYDAHVMQNDLVIAVPANCVLYDTLTQAKILDSDRISYSLDALSKDWLGNDISQYEHAFAAYLFDGRGHRVNKDYGEIPISLMAPYGGQDVLTTRDLKKYIEKHLPASCKLVSKNEIKLTKILFNMENVGMCVDDTKVQIKQVETQWRLVQIIDKIGELTGIAIRPNSPDDCYRLLCGQFGLPILKWTNEGDESKASKPSFDKEAMAAYERLPQIIQNDILSETVALIKEFKVLDQFNNLFLESFKARNKDGRLHANYNQCVSTGRLSCSDPNAQQFNSMAKGLVEVPDNEWYIMDIDLSQIDYRVVASAINNPAVVERYRNDPTTDFHQFVASTAGISRRHGKTLNLAMGFGMGEASAVELVKSTFSADNPEFLQSTMDFDTYCTLRSKKMYKDYHTMLPELKATSSKAAEIAGQLGYIANLYGRRRHFPAPKYVMYMGKMRWMKFYHRAFASYVQSSAADIAKHLTILIDELICNSDLIHLIGVIHDSWVFYVHKSVAVQYALEISRIIRSLDCLRVPILNSCEISSTNWRACKKIPNFSFGV